MTLKLNIEMTYDDVDEHQTTSSQLETMRFGTVAELERSEALIEGVRSRLPVAIAEQFMVYREPEPSSGTPEQAASLFMDMATFYLERDAVEMMASRLKPRDWFYDADRDWQRVRSVDRDDQWETTRVVCDTVQPLEFVFGPEDQLDRVYRPTE